MFQLTMHKSDGIGFEVHMVVGDDHTVKYFDIDIDAKVYFLEMAKDIAK